jgi:hypothetical protein
MNTDMHGGKAMAGNTENDGGRRGGWRKVVWGTAAFLWLLLLVAMLFTTEVNLVETVAYGVILLAAAGTFELALALRTRNSAYRIASCVALAAAFVLGWVNGAVGIIGNEGQPANLMYSGLIAVGLIGALVARFRPRGLSRVLIVVALAQALVPVIALIMWPQVSWGAAGMLGVFVLNAFFVMLFAGSALLFRRAANVRPELATA